MEFKIKHYSKLFMRGIMIPLWIFITVLSVYIFLRISFLNDLSSMVFLCVFAAFALTELVFITLYLTEDLRGTKIIIESDHVEIRLLLRHRILSFDEIDQAKYSHFTGSKYPPSHSVISIFLHQSEDGEESNLIRSELEFFLVSGEILSLNDDAPGYKQKRELAKVNPHVDPDDEVVLYQAYRCFCGAYERYCRAGRQQH